MVSITITADYSYPTFVCLTSIMNLIMIKVVTWNKNVNDYLKCYFGQKCNFSNLARCTTSRLILRVMLEYKIKQELVAIPLPTIVTAPIRSTPIHPHDYNNIYASTDAYKNSFFIRTVKQWNCLPQSIYSKERLLSFKAALDSYSLC